VSRGNGTSDRAHSVLNAHRAAHTRRKAALVQPSETPVQAAICALLDLLGLCYSVTDAARVWSRNGKVVASKVRRGWPDISLVLPNGRAAFMEVKSHTGRLRPDQAVMIQKLREASAYVAVVRSLDDAIFELNGWLEAGTPVRAKFDRIHVEGIRNA